MKCTNLTGNYSRLLVDLNRSPKSKNLYSQYTKHFPLEWRRNILESYYLPYRKSVEEFITRHIDKREKILHLSIHSFTPELNGKIRDNDVGLLYDPARRGEKDISEKIKRDFLDKIPGLKIRKNYPYFGTSDGFTSWLRKEYNMKQYLGIEIEMNQKLYFDKSEKYEQLKMNLPEIIKNIARAV